MTTHPTPTIGRIVLYRGGDDKDHPAIVVGVNSEFNINLYVFPNKIGDGDFGIHANVTHEDAPQIPQPGTWRWMPYQIQTAGQRHQDVPKAEPLPTTSTLTLSYGEALIALKAGKKVARAGWNGKGMWLVLMPALYLPPFNTQGTERKVNDRTAKWIGEDKPLDCQPYIAMWTAQQKWQPGWLASQADMLADDWCVV